MCGPAGSGKSTWAKKQIAECKYPCIYVSRDEVRAEFLNDEDKNIFAYEDDVFDEFCRRISTALENIEGPDVVFADATHLSEKARNKVLDRLDVSHVDIYPVAFRLPLEQNLRQNENRRGNVRTYVPRSVIRRMYYQWQPPTENEKYTYKHILLVGDAKGDEIE